MDIDAELADASRKRLEIAVRRFNELVCLGLPQHLNTLRIFVHVQQHGPDLLFEQCAEVGLDGKTVFGNGRGSRDEKPFRRVVILCGEPDQVRVFDRSDTKSPLFMINSFPQGSHASAKDLCYRHLHPRRED
jgi:hypothetical protein